MLLKKSKTRAEELLNQRCSLPEVEEAQRRQIAEESAMESGSLHVSHLQLSALIRFIMRGEIVLAFNRLQSQLDALKVKLDTSCQKLGEMEAKLVGMDCGVATLGNLIKENKELKDKIEMLEIHS